MLRDTTGQLQALVQAFVDTPAAERLAWVNPIIFAWAGVGDLSPDSRGPNVDARELAVLEFFTGQHFYQLNGSNGGAIDNPGANSATAINGIFDRLTAAVYQQLLESHFAPELNSINVIGSPSGFEYDFTEMAALLQAMYEQDNRGVPELIVFSNTLLNIFDGRSYLLENLRALGDLNTGFSGMLGRMGYINLLGDANDNVLSSSNFQDDILLGMAGDDQLSGKGGSDWLQGGGRQ